MLEREDEMSALDVDGLIVLGMEKRPDLRNTEMLLEQSEALVGIGKSNYFPTVSGVVSGDARRGDNGYFEEDDVSSTIGIQLQYNIYTGGRRKAVLHENRAFNREIKHVLNEQNLAVSAEVREAARTLETAQQLLVLQRETTALVEQNRDLVEKEYRAGQGSLVRLNQAQRDLTSQQANLASARVSMRQAWVNLNSATGAILDQ
jgi:outer membrane protein